VETIITLALAATTVVKVLVDLARMAAPLPRWLPPLLAIGSGILVVLLLMVAEGRVVTAQLAAQAVLAGIMTGGMAVGVTEVARRAQ
jgi:hypothetical protein